VVPSKYRVILIDRYVIDGGRYPVVSTESGEANPALSKFLYSYDANQTHVVARGPLIDKQVYEVIAMKSSDEDEPLKLSCIEYLDAISNYEDKVFNRLYQCMEFREVHSCDIAQRIQTNIFMKKLQNRMDRNTIAYAAARLTDLYIHRRQFMTDWIMKHYIGLPF
jgi:hypothetical protein